MTGPFKLAPTGSSADLSVNENPNLNRPNSSAPEEPCSEAALVTGPRGEAQADDYARRVGVSFANEVDLDESPPRESRKVISRRQNFPLGHGSFGPCNLPRAYLTVHVSRRPVLYVPRAA